MSSEIRLLVVRGDSLSPDTVFRYASELSPDERVLFSRMTDPVAADVRTVLRATANRLRAEGETVSVAHAGRFGVLVHAKARSREGFSLGVDCEPWAGETPSPETVREVTSPEEFSRWSVLPEPERRRAFIRLWTLKEASFKAGLGPMRSVPLDAGFEHIAVPGFVSVFVDVSPDTAVALVHAEDGRRRALYTTGL